MFLIHMVTTCVGCEPRMGPHGQSNLFKQTKASFTDLHPIAYHLPDEPACWGQSAQTGLPKLTDEELLNQLFQWFGGIPSGSGRPRQYRTPQHWLELKGRKWLFLCIWISSRTLLDLNPFYLAVLLLTRPRKEWSSLWGQNFLRLCRAPPPPPHPQGIRHRRLYSGADQDANARGAEHASTLQPLTYLYTVGKKYMNWDK